MLIDEELTLKKLEVFLAFMRSGNLARAASELQCRPFALAIERLHGGARGLLCAAAPEGDGREAQASIPG